MIFTAFLFLASVYSALAQTPATLMGAGYTAPTAPIPITSGQVVTLFFRGVPALPGGGMRAGQAQTTPLPTVLAGLSVRFVQFQVRIPIFAVRQENDCGQSEVNSACLLTSIRAQVPNYVLPEMVAVPEVDGQASRSFLSPVSVTMLTSSRHATRPGTQIGQLHGAACSSMPTGAQSAKRRRLPAAKPSSCTFGDSV